MHLEVVEILVLASEGPGSQHWSRNATRPRYSLSADDAKESSYIHSFTCFDVAERVDADHDVVFAGRSDGAVVLWRMVPRNMFGGSNKNDRLEETLVTSSPHRGAVTCLTHTHRGTYGSLSGPLVFSGSSDHTIKVWNAWASPPFKETCLQTMAEHRGGVTALAFAGDTTLISTSRDGSVRLWRPQRGRKLLRFPFFCCVKCLPAHPALWGGGFRSIGQHGAVADVWATTACVAGGETWILYCGDSDGTVSVFQRAPASIAERLAKEEKRRSDSLVMDQLADDEVTLRRRWTHLHSLAITGLVLVPEHNFLLSMGNDGACRVLDYLQGNTFMTIENKYHHIFTSVAWDLAHEQLVLADNAGVVQVWNTYTESLLLETKVAKAFSSTGPRRGQSLKALNGFYSSKSDGLLYGMSPSEGCFFRWKMVKDDGSTYIGGHDDSIVGLDFQGASIAARQRPCDSELVGKDVVSATAGLMYKDDRALVDDKAGGNACLIRSRGEQRSSVQGGRNNAGEIGEIDCGDKETPRCEGEDEVSFGLVVLSASMDGIIRAWEMLGKSEKYRMRHPVGVEVTSMLVLPGGFILATGTDDGCVRFWLLETGAGDSFRAHKNTVSALAANRNRQGSTTLASADFEGSITIWRARAKDGLKQNTVPTEDFSIHRTHGAEDGADAEILCLAFVVADTPLLTSAGNDGLIRCWLVLERTCTLLTTLEGHKDSIEILVTDGLFLLSGSCDGEVRVWNISSLEHDDNGLQGRSTTSPRSEIGQPNATMVGVIQAHPKGVADMAIMASARNSCDAFVLKQTEEKEEAVGYLATCGAAEAIVRIWDYTHVAADGCTCGRLITEVRSRDDSLFSCVACTQDASGKPLLFAGTTKGGIFQLAFDDTEADKRNGECEDGGVVSFK